MEDLLKTASLPIQCLGCLISCGCLAALITFCVYLGIYAYNNPEPQAFYVAATETSQPELVAYADVNDENVTAVHD